MRTIKFDENKLTEMKYRKAPILQINNLPDLTQRDKFILTALFGHSETFKLAPKRIANQFTPAMNVMRVIETLDKLESLDYLEVTNSNYIINLVTISNRTTITDKVTNRNQNEVLIVTPQVTDGNPKERKEERSLKTKSIPLRVTDFEKMKIETDKVTDSNQVFDGMSQDEINNLGLPF